MGIESFPLGTTFSIGTIYEIVLFMSFFISVAWFGWVGEHQAITFI